VNRYICIHGHFYQPPRENPWLEAVELQHSAYPYHDWNERITAECYAPNAASRILDGGGRIERIVNNYSNISFNYGPTLLSWLEEKAPETYEAVIAADQLSRKKFSGHGSAIAQVYNHMILPLANARDKETQVIWGIRDFERRFGRRPEGMWLPETAVDLETLAILARHGIRFTILSPDQARRVRSFGKRAWRDVTGGRIDPSRPYQLVLGTGQTISLFFYDGPISRGVAFEGLLRRGESLADRLLGAFVDSRSWPQIIHIATDGETYGHHQPHGDMALAYAIHYIERNGLAEFTNYAEYLAKHSPTHQVQIYENTSWSCVHGIERWRADCGCNSGMHAGWHQRWREPLREALDWLRDVMAGRFEVRGAGLLKDPWAARDDYIGVILDRSPENVDAFLDRHAVRPLSDDDRVRALKLLELQRHAMLMYTSCGWFFDEISGIETVQVLQYAGRVLQLNRELFEDDLESGFLVKLDRIPSNLPEFESGRTVYEKFVWPAMVNIEKVGVHYAVSSLFEDYGSRTPIYCYGVDREDYRSFSAGKIRLAVGRARVTSAITRESGQITFGVIHLGDQNINGGVRPFQDQEHYESSVGRIIETFEQSDFAELVREMDRSFGAGVYTLDLLFRDELRKILDSILAATLSEAEATYGQMFENHASLIRFITRTGIPLARHLQVVAEFTLNAALRRTLESDILDASQIRRILDEVRKTRVELDVATLEFSVRNKVERLADWLREEPAGLDRLQILDQAVDLVRMLPFEVNLWKAQNAFYGILQSLYPRFQSEAALGDEFSRNWLEQFRRLGEKLSVLVP
jgi:alpha-amylase/alpha-mannosidase (GH57 family)